MKSTSTAYATSFGISSSNEDVGLGNVGRTSLRAFSKYIVSRSGLKLSPCGVPTLFVNGFDVQVPLRRICISLCSSSSTIDLTISRRWRLFIVSKATDMAMPEIFIVVSSFSAFRDLTFPNLFNIQITFA